MVVNSALASLLDQTFTVFRPTDVVVNGVTTLSLSATTGVAGHAQAMNPGEAAKAYGYEEEGGRYEAFFHSTQDVRVGDLIKQTSGPHNGVKWWARGLATDSNVTGIAHLMVSLERTDEST